MGLILKIKLSEIEQALSTLLEALRRREGDTIELGPVDYYWAIGAEKNSKITREENSPGLRQAPPHPGSHSSIQPFLTRSIETASHFPGLYNRLSPK